MLHLQKPSLTNKIKRNILLSISTIVIIPAITFSLLQNSQGGEEFFVIHIASVILGSFLSIISALTFFEFRTRRLFLVSCAFFAVTIAEGMALFNFIVPIVPPDNSIHSLITHALILLMLAFFSAGIFRTD